MSKVSVIIISYNSEDFIEKCVSSLLKNLPRESEIIILDNASTDKTITILEKFLPQIRLIKSTENLGFAKGNNKAVKEANGEYLFFLNPDTQVKSGVINQLINFYEQTPNVGIVAPKLVMRNGQTQPSVKKLPTIWGAVKEFIFGIKNAYSEYVPEAKSPMEIEYVYGAAMLIEKNLFDKLSGFDEKYFLYYEDADLCKKVRDLGKKIYYYPGAFVMHLVGATKSKRDRYELSYESFVKYHGILAALVLQMIFLIPRLRRRLNVG